MAAANTAPTELTMKLLIKARERRVVYAEASRDVLAFLHSLLDSPDTSITLDDMSWHGCTDSILDSLEELDDLAARGGRPPPPPPPPPPPQEEARRFFVCAGRRRRGARCGAYVAVRSGARCPSCGGRMDAEAPRGAPGAGCSWAHGGGQQAGAGVGAGGLTCTLMDDLTIGPAPGSAHALGIDTAGVMKGVDPAAFQEATVRIGRKEGLAILEASLNSSCVLTDVFLRGDGKAPTPELQPTPLTVDLVLLGGYAHEGTRTH